MVELFKFISLIAAVVLLAVLFTEFLDWLFDFFKLKNKRYCWGECIKATAKGKGAFFNAAKEGMMYYAGEFDKVINGTRKGDLPFILATLELELKLHKAQATEEQLRKAEGFVAMSLPPADKEEDSE